MSSIINRLSGDSDFDVHDLTSAQKKIIKEWAGKHVTNPKDLNKIERILLLAASLKTGERIEDAPKLSRTKVTEIIQRMKSGDEKGKAQKQGILKQAGRAAKSAGHTVGDALAGKQHIPAKKAEDSLEKIKKEYEIEQFTSGVMPDFSRKSDIEIRDFLKLYIDYSSGRIKGDEIPTDALLKEFSKLPLLSLHLAERNPTNVGRARPAKGFHDSAMLQEAHVHTKVWIEQNRQNIPEKSLAILLAEHEKVQNFLDKMEAYSQITVKPLEAIVDRESWSKDIERKDFRGRKPEEFKKMISTETLNESISQWGLEFRIKYKEVLEAAKPLLSEDSLTQLKEVMLKVRDFLQIRMKSCEEMNEKINAKFDE